MLLCFSYNNALSPLFLIHLPQLHCYLEENVLTGRIPSQIGLMTSLSEFHCSLDYFQYYGCVSFVLISTLTSHSLDFPDLSDNSLTGQIPTEIALMVQLGESCHWLAETTLICLK